MYQIKCGLEIMKFFMLMCFFIFNCDVFAVEYHPRININDLIDKINNRNNAMYFNGDNLDERNSFKQVYYRNIIQDRNFSFQKGLIEYSFLKSDGIDSYGYAEHFYDCSNDEKIIYRQKYNNKGDFFSSEVLLVDLSVYSKDFDKFICNDIIFDKN